MGAKPKSGSVQRMARAAAEERDELRARIQETVHRFTALAREEIARKWADGWRVTPVGWVLPAPENIVLGEAIPPGLLEKLQPLMEEYDPVVELALVAADYGNPVELRVRANGDAAKYLRPQLKSIEYTTGEDPEANRTIEHKNELVNSVVAKMNELQRAKRLAPPDDQTISVAVIDVQPEEPPAGYKNGNGEHHG